MRKLERWWDSLTVVDHVNHYIEVKDLTSKDAIKQVATDRNMNKREVYHMYHVEEIIAKKGAAKWHPS